MTSDNTEQAGKPPRTPKAPNPDPFGFDAFDLLPERSSDDTDAGWGQREQQSSSDIRRFLDEKPPHHL